MQSKPFGELADGRTNNYDFLRFLFASLVIFGHSFIFVGFVGRGIDPISWISLQQTWSGDIAVDGFFAISGCLVTASFLRSRGIPGDFKFTLPPRLAFLLPILDAGWRVIDYFKKRVLRIYPGFIVATILCLLIVGPLASRNVGAYVHSVSWTQALRNMAQLSKIDHVDAFTTTRAGQPMDPAVVNELDGPMWSIRVEFECYILVAALGFLGLLRNAMVRSAVSAGMVKVAKGIGTVRGRNVVFALFVVCYILYASTAPAYRPVYAFQTHLYAALAGVSVAIAHLPIWHPIGRVIDRIVGLAGSRQSVCDHSRCFSCFLAGMCFYLYRELIPRSAKLMWAALAGLTLAIIADHIDAGIPLFGGYLLFYAAYNAAWKLDKWGEKHDLSYGLYLYGWPAQALVVYFLGSNMNAYVLFAMAMAAAAVCALLSWRFVESPALRLKSAKRKAALQAPPLAVVDDSSAREDAPPAATIPA